jgi:hypothetical protein
MGSRYPGFPIGTPGREFPSFRRKWIIVPVVSYHIKVNGRSYPQITQIFAGWINENYIETQDSD